MWERVRVYVGEGMGGVGGFKMWNMYIHLTLFLNVNHT